ncbi:MAG: class I SAM-dependent methyltransferase [Acholeplasmataceae bacterium]|nr:class I SAM-dependent methyltransferase [Acholeplasmataceae bacterium]
MFARAYDLLMADVDYDKIYKWLKPYIHKDKMILDAGCGSGYLMLELLRNGYQVMGIDIDTKMLSVANDKLVSNHFKPMLYEHDLRDSLGIKVDVVLAMFDVINYFKGIRSVFKNIYQSLNDGGIFVFDVYKDEIVAAYDQYTEIDDEPFHYEWHIATKKNQLIHSITIGKKTEIIKQFVYPVSYYENILKTLGFLVEIKEGIDSRKLYVIAYK